MARGIDISALGVPELQRKLSRLDLKHQGKAVRPALRASAKRLQPKIVENIRTRLVNSPPSVRTGTLERAFSQVKVKALKGSGVVGVGVPLPERSLLGDKALPPYYPTAVEYGHKALGVPVRPYPYIRPAVNENRRDEVNSIASDIAARILALAGQDVGI